MAIPNIFLLTVKRCQVYLCGGKTNKSTRISRIMSLIESQCTKIKCITTESIHQLNNRGFGLHCSKCCLWVSSILVLLEMQNHRFQTCWMKICIIARSLRDSVYTVYRNLRKTQIGGDLSSSLPQRCWGDISPFWRHSRVTDERSLEKFYWSAFQERNGLHLRGL